MPKHVHRDGIKTNFHTSTIVLAAAFATAIFALFSGNVALDNKLPIIMLTTLLILAVLEHRFMVLPVSYGALWRRDEFEPFDPS